ncbi:MAG: S-layer homology domain-containing protein, partial [Solibacillus sp.]
EYRLVGEATWTKVTGAEVINLAPGNYEVREAETATHKAGESVKVNVREGATDSSSSSSSRLLPGPLAPAGVTAQSESMIGKADGKILGVEKGQEYRKVGSTIWQPITGAEIENLSSGEYEIRVAETSIYEAGEIVTVVVGVGLIEQGLDAPTGMVAIAESVFGAKDGELIGVEIGQEYRAVGTTEWQPITSTKVTGLAPGEYEVRIAETPEHQASAVSIVKIEEGPSMFSDTDGHWANALIAQFALNQYITGYPDQTFRPNEPLQRKHLAVILTRMFDFEAKRDLPPFSDVPETHTYYAEIMTMQQAGIIDGYEGYFNPNNNTTRAQMAKMIVNVFEIPLQDETSFTDVDAAHWSYPYIAALEAAEIALGDNGKFNPNEPVTRAQFVAFLARALEKFEKQQKGN